VAADTRGGREQMIFLLARELLAQGHEVTLIASGDSTPLGQLVVICPEGVLSAMEKGDIDDYSYYEAAAISETLRIGDSVDLVHSHLDCGFVPFASLLHVPVLHTLHGAVTRDMPWLIHRFPQTNLATVGQHQEATLQEANTITTIQNGIDVTAFPFCGQPQDYLLFLGRLDPIKGPHLAIEIAKSLGKMLILAGPIVNRTFFEQQIAPKIDCHQIKYVGHVQGWSKIELLQKARGLLFPVLWEEPFGLVMVEAMACGTPVVALRRGSVPDIVVPGINGFYGECPGDLPGLVQRLDEIDRAQVHRSVQTRFSHKRMVNDYQALYHRLRQPCVRG
jgi:glycosyltransferase involved in cell wall biosynthesis